RYIPMISKKRIKGEYLGTPVSTITNPEENPVPNQPFQNPPNRNDTPALEPPLCSLFPQTTYAPTRVSFSVRASHARSSCSYAASWSFRNSRNASSLDHRSIVRYDPAT